MNELYDLSEVTWIDSTFLDQVALDLKEGQVALDAVCTPVTIYGSSRARSGDRIYEGAEALARSLALNGYAVITGGGPGVMEAANKGAQEAGGGSIGINVWLPQGQESNIYATVALRVRYFFVRKLLLLRHSRAVIFLPGGYGTFDELFETLTLIQTRRVRPIPVILFGSWFWKGLAQWIEDQVWKDGLIDHPLFQIQDTIEGVVATIHDACRPGELEGIELESKG